MSSAEYPRMQARSYVENLDDRLHIYPSADADSLKRKLLDAADDPRKATAFLESIGRTLLTRVCERQGAAESRSGGPLVPILVLRGGLALWQPTLDVFGACGVIVPARSAPGGVAYCSVPTPAGATYALVDVLVATGRTISICLQALSALPVTEVIAPFVAAQGRQRLFAENPDVRLHCIWHDEAVEATGRMRGPGFDVGDYALGHGGEFFRVP